MRKLLVINQLFSDYLIDFKHMSNIWFTNVSAELKKQIGIWYEIKWRKLRLQIMIIFLE